MTGTWLPAEQVGQSIRAVRELAGLSLTEAATLTGRSAERLAQVEAGTATNVSSKYVANTIGALCAYMVGASRVNVA